MKKLLYVQYTNPAAYPPLEHSSQILAQDGWEVLFLGIGALGASALSFPTHPKIHVKQMYFCSGGWRQKLHYIQFCLWVLFWTLRWKPLWIYASDFLSCPIGLLLSFLPGVKVIYHEHDSPSPSLTSFVGKFCLWSRQKLARRVNYCILPNQKRIEYFTEQTNREQTTLCVWNCPSIIEISKLYLPNKFQEIWLYYHGNISAELIPSTIIYALATLNNNIKLRIIGYETVGSQGYIGQLKKVATELEVRDRVEFLNSMPRYELLEWCKKCDVGIAFMPKKTEDINLKHMIGASNKVFDYMACGLALLVCDLPDWQQMYVEPGYGLACDPEDVQSVCAAVDWFLEHFPQMRQMGELGRQRITQDWNYENQFKPVMEILQNSIK